MIIHPPKVVCLHAKCLYSTHSLQLFTPNCLDAVYTQTIPRGAPCFYSLWTRAFSLLSFVLNSIYTFANTSSPDRAIIEIYLSYNIHPCPYIFLKTRFQTVCAITIWMDICTDKKTRLVAKLDLDMWRRLQYTCLNKQEVLAVHVWLFLICLFPIWLLIWVLVSLSDWPCRAW